MVRADCKRKVVDFFLKLYSDESFEIMPKYLRIFKIFSLEKSFVNVGVLDLPTAVRQFTEIIGLGSSRSKLSLFLLPVRQFTEIIGLGSSRSKLSLFLLPIRTHLITDSTNRFPLLDLILHEAHILHNDLLK